MSMVEGTDALAVEFAFESNLIEVRSRQVVASGVIFKLKCWHLMHNKIAFYSKI